MLRTRKGPLRIRSHEDITLVAQLELPFRFVIVIFFAAARKMNLWELDVSLVHRVGLDFSNPLTGCDDHPIWQFHRDGIVDRLAIIEPRPADPESNLDEYIHLGKSKRSRLHDDSDALCCSPFEPEDDDEPKPNTLDSSQVNWRCIDEIDWQAEKAKDDRAMAIGDPQPGNTVDVLDQARQVLDDIEKYGGALPY